MTSRPSDVLEFKMRPFGSVFCDNSEGFTNEIPALLGADIDATP
jgi:hypothetical protein